MVGYSARLWVQERRMGEVKGRLYLRVGLDGRLQVSRMIYVIFFLLFCSECFLSLDMV